MKKFAPLFIAAASLASLQGCATDSGALSEMTAEDQAAACFNPEGTNAAIAALATAITQELHRWNIAAIPAKYSPTYVPGVAADFYTYTGYNNQRMLGLTSAGLAACGGSCPLTQNLLAYQDSRMDQKIVFNGVKLSSYSFASRLTSGFDKQVACNNGGWCAYTSHVFGFNPATGAYDGFTTAPGPCDTMFTFNAHKPVNGQRLPLSATEVNNLKNALVWTAANGDNPYIAFQSTASTVSIDPTGQTNPPGQTTGSDVCQKVSLTNIYGQACTCATFNIYSNGALKNDDPLAPKTYFCRQM